MTPDSESRLDRGALSRRLSLPVFSHLPVSAAIDWKYVGRRVVLLFYLGLAVSFTIWSLNVFITPDTTNLFLDSHIYYRATDAWVNGANPWQSNFSGVYFAAPPPALLLNLPFLWMGEGNAVAAWALLNAASIGFIFWRLHLPLWLLLINPIVEGFVGGSPDLALAGLVFIGAGGFSALVKPYSAPAILGYRRWRAIAAAVVMFVLTALVLPWQMFFETQGFLTSNLADKATLVSALGSPLLMIVTAVALVSLGPASGLQLFTPGLIAGQPHYLVFSLEVISKSMILWIFMTIPLEHYAAYGIILYAAVEFARRRRAGSNATALDEIGSAAAMKIR
jgi:hypothetical protein